MRLCTFRPGTGGTAGAADLADAAGFPGRIDGDLVIRLAAPSLQAVLAADLEVGNGESYPLSDVRLLAPIPEPPAVRDFISFEQHIATTRQRRGAEVPPQWYAMPVFYFSNPACIVGPDAVICRPEGCAQLDYELEVAAVIGDGGRISGFTVMNDWSARDLQAEETRVGLGPAKAKDFATSLGPVLVTVDEFDGSTGLMTARVNGQERSRGQLGELYHPWSAMIARAGRDTRLRPGDVIGSGTVGTGCILEHGDGRWLQPGDEVELEVEGIGILRNRIG